LLDGNNPIPFHLQIRKLLEEEISEGRYEEKIPSERELMNRFSVSRTTIREAISHLVHDGILEKIHGKGTFISQKPPIHEWLHSLNSLTETIKNMGMVPGAKLLNCGNYEEPTYISEILNVNTFYSIERLRTANSTPIAIERHYYPKELGLQLSKHDLETSTIYDLMENHLGIELVEAEQFISSKIVDSSDAVHLELPVGSSVLCVERLIINASGEPIEYYTSHFRPDMYVYRIKTKRKNG
jgi:GntR family transcriptional regulator